VAIVRAVAELGRGLGKDITVEAVETEGQIKLLNGLGCTQYQGYYFSRPLDPAAVPNFIAGFNAIAPLDWVV
jgi:EAL domain-containing protein (putative c-di-GMP-specific phosphodiesterase class I)